MCAAVALAALPAHALPLDVTMTGTWDHPIPIAFLDPQQAPPAPALALPAPLSPSCGASHYAGDSEEGSFSFGETEEEAGCLQVRYNVTLPPGIDHFTLTFEANRSVRLQGLAGGRPPNMLQQVRLVDPQGASHQSFDVFAPHDASQPRTVFLPFTFEAQGRTVVQVEWLFADLGPTEDAVRGLGPAPVGAFSATVWGPRVQFDGIPLETPTVTAAEGGLDGNSQYVAQFTVAASVPEAFRSAAAAGQFALKLHLGAGLDLGGVDGPDGQPLPDGSYGAVLDGGRRSLTIPAATLLELGPGPYRVHLDVPDLLRPHPTYQLLSFVAMGAPAVAIVGAWVGLRRTELEVGLEGEP